MTEVPVSLAYCLNTSSGVGPGRRKVSKIPDSEIQWVSVDFSLAWDTSIQVSEPERWKTATVESVEWACMSGMEP